MRSFVLALLCGVVFLVPWEEAAIIPVVGTAASFVGYIAAASGVCCVALRLSFRPLPIELGLLGLHFLLSAASVFWSVNPAETAGRILTQFSLLGFLWLTWEFAPAWRQQLRLFQALLVGCVFTMVWLLIGFRSDVPRSTEPYTRYTGGAMNQNQLAMILAVAIAVAIYLATQTSAKGTWLRIVYWAFVPLAAMALFLTGSRSGFLGAALSVGVGLIVFLRAGWGLKLMLVSTAVVAAVLVMKFVPTGLLERATETRETGGLKARLEIWEASLKLWQETPQNILVGTGAGTHGSPELTEKLVSRSAHNTVVELLLENGVIGLLLCAAALALILRRVFYLRPSERLLWLMALTAWGVPGMANTYLYTKISWLLCGLILCQSAEQHQVQPVRVFVRRRQPAG